MDILRAGKQVYSEKPLGISVEEGRGVLNLAKERNLRVGSSPDTFLEAGYQTCRKLIDDGWIGPPLSGTVFMQASGPESWHPSLPTQKRAGGLERCPVGIRISGELAQYRCG